MEQMADVVAHTQAWVSSVVVGENFCPFARREVVNNRVRYVVAPSAEAASTNKQSEHLEAILMLLQAELQYLDAHESTETTLIICPEGFDDFNNYLDFFELAEDQLARQGFEGIYQVASFHPQYCFDGASAEDAANYTNRSPYPMLHLIREESIEKVLENIENPEDIPNRNIQHARQLGIETMREKLAACFKK